MLVVISIILILISILRYRHSRFSNFPPGPPGLPIVGHLFLVGKQPEKKFLEFAKKYGDIFSVQYGSHRVVVLNNHKDIRDAFANPVFCGRPKFNPNAKIGGIFFNNGYCWKEQRDLTMKILREKGFGKSSTEQLMQSEVSKFMETLSSLEDKPVNPKHLFLIPVINSIWPIAVGKRLTQEDPVFQTLLQDFIPPLEEPSTAIIRYFPTLFAISKRITWLFPKARRKEQRANSANVYFTQLISEHQESINWDGASHDLIDEYLKHINGTTDMNSHFYRDRGFGNLVRTLYELLLAGGDSTARALVWTFLLLAKNLEIQRKLQAEIDNVLQNALPSLNHKNLMPYTQSVILEVLRFASLGPLGIFHCTTENTSFRGFDIPKDTIIIPNMYGIMHDPKEWTEPEQFRPERFLSADGRTVEKPAAFLAFSSGKRMCLGMSHALDSLFLFTTRIFQNFDIYPGSETEALSTDYTSGLMNSPLSFQVKVVRRLVLTT